MSANSAVQEQHPEAKKTATATLHILTCLFLKRNENLHKDKKQFPVKIKKRQNSFNGNINSKVLQANKPAHKNHTFTAIANNI